MLGRRFKLGIIGGGITGAYAAFLASQKGIEVEVFEKTAKDSWLNNPLVTRKCGEGIWKRKLENAGINISSNSPPDYLENYTQVLILGFLRQNKFDVLKGRIDPYLFINRQKFERDFYETAVEKGAIWHFGEEIKNLNVWQRKNKFDFIVGAWGTNPALTSQVVKEGFLQEFVLACQYTLKDIDFTHMENAKTLILTEEPTVRYFYIFPKKGKNLAEVNLGVVFNDLKVQRPFEKLDWFLKSNPLGMFSGAKVSPERTFAKILNSGPPVKKENLLDDSLFLLGDAGFTTDAVSGGGMGYGLLAAKKAVESCSAPDPRARFYQQLSSLSQDLEKSYNVSKKFYPKKLKEKKRVIELFFRETKMIVQNGGALSLGKIAEKILLK